MAPNKKSPTKTTASSTPAEKDGKKLLEEDVEEVQDDDDEVSSDEDSDDAKDKEAGGEKSKVSRSEKKARKAVARLGIKPLEGVKRVVLKRSKQILFVFNNPTVYKPEGSDTYIVFGEAKVEDLAAQAQANAAKAFAGSAAASGLPSEATAPTTSGAKAPIIEEVDEAEIDESGMDPKDIELVMSQVECTRARAVTALKANNNDVVEAIMFLSS